MTYYGTTIEKLHMHSYALHELSQNTAVIRYRETLVSVGVDYGGKALKLSSKVQATVRVGGISTIFTAGQSF